MSKIKKVYNKQYKSKMIKIEQYKLDPTKEGHQLMVSWKVNKRKPPIIDGDAIVRSPRLPRKSLDERIAEALTVALKPVTHRLDAIDFRLDSIERIQQEQGEILKEHTEIFKRNNLR